MTRVRPFRRDDIPAVLALRTGIEESEHDGPQSLAAYFDELFFCNPWVDDQVSSLVCENGDRVVGFLGVIPRPMTLKGARLRVAATTHFSAAPDAGPAVALQLLRTLFQGPQDISISDVASWKTRRLWEYFGGVTAYSSSVTWVRLLRPVRQALSTMARTGVLAAAGALAAGPADVVATRVVRRFHAPSPSPGTRREAVTDADLLAHLTSGADGRALRGDYDAASLPWLLAMLQRKRGYGPLRRSRVLDDRGHVLGWYVAYMKSGGNARVAHIGTRPGAAGVVLEQLFAEAWRAGCAAVSGRFDARIMEACVERGCLMTGAESWVMLHARDRELLDAVARDDGAITRLDGEWWIAY
ncbi:MAG TPA: hypothetical protein VEA38_18465 [Terriglobales bacterium]|nr:hypothetical protein [Terriglobales bacterium]